MRDNQYSIEKIIKRNLSDIRVIFCISVIRYILFVNIHHLMKQKINFFNRIYTYIRIITKTYLFENILGLIS